ncbi:hypothetical protein PUN28_009315 [Cardiocondyla obscurior]|uniref:Uncharacterized protein n=1 Tax=Cardiocondyla obscurior TaxID=286306 RepID=A0AAW2FX96_9HYME
MVVEITLMGAGNRPPTKRSPTMCFVGATSLTLNLCSNVCLTTCAFTNARCSIFAKIFFRLTKLHCREENNKTDRAFTFNRKRAT